MCLAVPGKIVAFEGSDVLVDYGSEVRRAKIVCGEFKLGDHVLVSAGIVNEKVDDEQVEGWLNVLEGAENA